jgi:lipoyl(octanoyl) transferase
MDIAREAISKGAPECVFVVEHKRMYSVGKSSKTEDFTKIPNAKIYYTNRGGRITVHSQGQIVIYPIINLKKRGLNITNYVKILEDWMVRVLEKFKLHSKRSNKGIGVWISNIEKIGFIGIRVEHGITSHGLCLNVSNELALFDAIIPCGINEIQITSMMKILGKTPRINEVAEMFIANSPF